MNSATTWAFGRDQFGGCCNRSEISWGEILSIVVDGGIELGGGLVER